MKKTMILTMVFLLLASIAPPAQGEATPPISSGVVNKTACIYWGKGIQFPVLATVFAGTKLDVYEYDMSWALVLYRTYGSYLGKYQEMSFYGYMGRDDITCDPPLEGEASARADTGPGKKKGKRPKPAATLKPAGPTPDSSRTPAQTGEPEVTVEPMEEFDWIIRTNGLQAQTVAVEGMAVVCSFSLMAQKAGGTSASSDPTFNSGVHTPYAAAAFYSMKLGMASALEDLGLSFLSGEGGFDISLQASGTSFFIDTGAENFALVNFTLPMQGTGKVGGMVTDGNLKVDSGVTSVSGDSNLPIQMKKSGSGYKFVLVGLRPGGGDLEFPAVLEKTFADPNRFDKEAAEADARRKKAEAERDKWLEAMKTKAEETAKATEDPLEGVSLTGTEDPFADVSLTGTEDPLEGASLTPSEDPLDNVTLIPPPPEDEAPPFPVPSGGLERRETQCA